MKRFKLSLGCCGLLLAFPRASLAKISLDVGAYRESLAQSQMVAKRGLWSGVGRIRLDVPVGPVAFEPSLALCTPRPLDSEGTRLAFTALTGLDFAFPLSSWLRLRVGPGVELSLAVSEERAVVLRNGESSSVFYSPGGSAFSLRFLVEAGLEFPLGEGYSLGVDFFVSELFAERTRRLHTLGYLGMSL